MKIPTVSIFSVPISQMNMEDTVRYLTEAIQQNKSTHVITANAIMIMAGLERAEFMGVLKRADLVVPDGAGLVWASRYIDNPVAERVAGIDLMQRLLQTGDAYGWKVFLLGASPESVELAAEKLQLQYPGIRLAGYRDGFFRPDQDEEVVARIRETAPDLLFVANSQDRQDPWIDRYRNRLNVPLMMGVGGSFDIIAGKLKRAPEAFRRLHLEWFYRLLQEPSRCGRMLALPKFAVKVIREKEKVQKHE